MLRISEAIPDSRRVLGPVTHNVLDSEFEHLGPGSQHEQRPPYILVPTTGQSYKNIPRMLEAFSTYRCLGGRARLVVTTEQPPSTGLPRVRHIERDIAWGPLDRQSLLRAMAFSSVTVLPSLVEASPVTVLEAAALSPRVCLSRIDAHEGILAYNHVRLNDNFSLFDPMDPESIAESLFQTEQATADLGDRGPISTQGGRESLRRNWGDSVARHLAGLGDG
ncbi:MAG: glycosyltransferase family 4 protein [bacterium]|nr:glycosyltransferase family 4 protein [bacterium]